MKLTPQLLRTIVKEEMARFGKMRDVDSEKAKETDADEYAGSLEKKHDFYKALGLEEARLIRRLRRVQEQRRRMVRRSVQG